MKKYLNYIIFLGLLIAIILVYIESKNSSPKIAYVNLESLYNDFQMKKELEGKLSNVQEARKGILDSMKIQLNMLSVAIKSEKDETAIRKFQLYKQEYLFREKSFDEENRMTTQTYSNQIWKQINQYVKDYGKSEGYDYIIGAEGSGTIMYATEKNNLTALLTEYINSRYTGDKK